MTFTLLDALVAGPTLLGLVVLGVAAEWTHRREQYLDRQEQDR